MTSKLSRRAFLGTACSAAASPLVTPVVFAATPGEARLVVILLRGALDGIGAIVPRGERRLAELRPGLSGEPMADLDGFFALSTAFEGLMDLWRSGEFGAVHAVSTPYRDGRSHFDGQDALEMGSPDRAGSPTPGRDGWLNRAIGAIPGARASFGLAVGQSRMLMMSGEAPVSAWSPSTTLALGDDERGLLTRLYADDPLFAAAHRGAMGFADPDDRAERENGRNLASFAAERLNAEARIAAFSLGGWDTHRNQAGQIQRPARELAEAILTLKGELGRNWARTAVIALTEFGRTVRENGSRGTDHGTGGAMLYAGGALTGGRVAGRWPGLDTLYEDRDLTPTADVRAYAGQILAGQFGLAASTVERDVFPGVDLGEAGRILG